MSGRQQSGGKGRINCLNNPGDVITGPKDHRYARLPPC